MVILLEKKGFVFHIDPGPSPVGRLRRAGTLAAADVCIVCNREFLPHFPAQGKRLFGRQGRRMRRAEKEREGGGERRAGQSGRGAAPGMTEEAVCAGKLAGRNGVQEKRKPCVRSSGERGGAGKTGRGGRGARRRLHLRHILFALRPCGAGAGQRARLPSPFDLQGRGASEGPAGAEWRKRQIAHVKRRAGRCLHHDKREAHGTAGAVRGGKGAGSRQRAAPGHQRMRRRLRKDIWQGVPVCGRSRGGASCRGRGHGAPHR